ncbi:hypothetical protein ACFRLW_22360 [Streptomyces sp. NPDC056728]
MNDTISVQEFRHTSTQGFYLVAGKERVATATQSGDGWRLVWKVGSGSPIVGLTPLSVMRQALDTWPAVRATVKEETVAGWSVPAEVGVSRGASPMGGQPGFRR